MGGPDVPADGIDEAAAERARTLETILQAGMAVLALGALSALFRAGPVLDTAFPYLSMLAGHALALVIARTGRQRLAVSVHVALYLGVVGMVMVRYGGIRSPAGFVLPPIVMVAGLTWNGRADLATAGAAALLTVAMVVLERRGALPPASAPPPDRLAVVTVGTLLITGAILAVALRAIETATHRALQHERARHRLEERLTDARRLETVAPSRTPVKRAC
jgi:hypothetical protein